MGSDMSGNRRKPVQKMMSEIAIIAISIAAVLIVAAVCGFYRQRKVMNSLSDMIQAAIDGTFTERHFDESQMSSVENALAAYLQSSELLARRRSGEKDKIKELIADISHQTKTPIANLLLYTELLQETELPHEAAGYVRDIHDQTEKLNFLIVSLVRLSRLETGIVTLHPEPGDLGDLAHRITKKYEEKAKQKGLILREETDSSMKPVKKRALFDGRWTEEAIGNLLDNAVKYTSAGSVTVRIKAYEMFACVEVADTGKGIPEEEIPKIFARFYRGEGNYQEEGVGIGLYLARQIIEEENGYIKVTSRPGCGSAFSVFLPWSDGM